MEQKLYLYNKNDKIEIIMATIDLRNTVKEYINTADLKGESKSFTWEQVKQNARNAS